MAGDCDCAAGPDACAPDDVSPDPHVNRPGLPALAYRRGTWATVLRRLKAELDDPLQGEAGTPSARSLNTAASDDPAVALLDAFSAVADVLTFYQERIANEGYLRTATERMSVGLLAGALGYRLAPGVAAAADLVFVVDDADKAPKVATVPAGTMVMHIPTQGEIPQPFETTHELFARAEWNTLAVPTQRDPVMVGSSGAETLGILDLAGTSTGLRQHSRLLLLYGEFDAKGAPPPWRLHRVKSAVTDSRRGITRVTWDPSRSLGTSLKNLPNKVLPKPYLMRTTTALFGWSAPDWHSLPEDIRKTFLVDGAPSEEWPLFNVLPSLAGLRADGNFETEQPAAIDLTQEHPEIEPGSLVVLADVSGNELAGLYRVDEATRVWRQAFRLSGNVTRLTPSHSQDLERFGLRESSVYAASDALQLAQVDDASLVGLDRIEVVGEVSLPEGRRVLVGGYAEGSELYSWQVAVVAACVPQGGLTSLELDPEHRLGYALRREGLVVHANVAQATHGKTVSEVLGSGDGSVPFQSFWLKQRPLTWLSDPSSPTGASHTLSVRVGRIEWSPVPSLLDQDQRARAYVTELDDAANTRVTFGDGVYGSRLPSGAENVVATYRVGVGKVGEVAAGSIALLAKKPVGVRSVSNVLPSSGAEDPETLQSARARAPESVLVLQRVVSVSDYADFARGFAGVGKAAGAVLWDRDRQVLHLTVTDTSGQAFAPDAPVFENLRAALLLWGDAEVPLVVSTLDAAVPGAAPGPRRFGLTAALRLDPAWLREDVLAEAYALLQARFGQQARDLAQSVSAAEILAALHEVQGIVAVDLRELYLVTDVRGLASCLPAWGARTERTGALRPAELLVLEPAAVDLEGEMAP